MNDNQISNHQCMWIRLPDVLHPLDTCPVRFYIPCIGELAHGAHAFYPDACPHCKKRVAVASSPVETSAPRALALGDEVTYTPLYDSKLPREGWQIEVLPKLTYVIKHPNGSIIAVDAGELNAVEPTVSHMGPSGMRCVVAEGCPDPYLCTRARRCERVSPEKARACTCGAAERGLLSHVHTCPAVQHSGGSIGSEQA